MLYISQFINWSIAVSGSFFSRVNMSNKRKENKEHLPFMAEYPIFRKNVVILKFCINPILRILSMQGFGSVSTCIFCKKIMHRRILFTFNIVSPHSGGSGWLFFLDLPLCLCCSQWAKAGPFWSQIYCQQLSLSPTFWYDPSDFL